ANGNAPARCICFGNFQLDVQEQQLFQHGAPVKIQGKVYQALLALVQNPGEIVTRETLRTRLWPRDVNLNYDANVNTTVNKLRQLLGDTNEESNFIETIPRKGYTFIAKVDYANKPVLAAAGKNESGKKMPSIWKLGALPGFLRSDRARIWFTASVVT